MEWPLKEDDKFRSTPTAKRVWSAVLNAFPEESEQKMAAMEHLAAVKNWRNDYYSIVEEIMTIMALASPKDALLMAQTGLDALGENMLFRKDDGSTVSAKEAFDGDIQVSWETKTLHGSKDYSKNGEYVFSLGSPTGGEALQGADAVAQLQAWADYGCMEPSAAAHASRTCELTHVDVSKQVFVLLGATSELGPARILLSIPNAHVLAIARPGPKLTSLVEWFQESCPSSSTLQVPGDGADLLKHGPQIAQWIVDTVPSDKQVVICHNVYMDGEAHVRASLAMDLITTRVCANHSNVALSFLSSPSTVMAVPPDAAQAAKGQSRGTWQDITHYMSVGHWLKEWNYDEGVLNGMAHAQGPNYALAKSMQQWRCMVAAFGEKRLVSAPMAPATRTQNMVRHSTISVLLEGMQRVQPMVTFNVEPCCTLMTSILLSQLTSPYVRLEHPMHVTWDGSVHGGVWRCPYVPESVHTVSYLLGRMTPTGYIPPESLARETEEGA